MSGKSEWMFRRKLVAVTVTGFVLIYVIISYSLPSQHQREYSYLDPQFHILSSKGHTNRPRRTIGLLRHIVTGETIGHDQLPIENATYNHLGCFTDTDFGPKANRWKASGFRVKSQQECTNRCSHNLKTAFALYKRNVRVCLCEHWYNSEWKHEGECSRFIPEDTKHHDVMYFGNVTGLVIGSRPEWRCSCLSEECLRIRCKNVRCWVGPTQDDLSELLTDKNSCPENHYTVLPFSESVPKRLYCIPSGSLRGFWPKKKCMTRGRLYQSTRIYEIKSQDGDVEVQMVPDKNQTKIVLLGFYRSASTLMSEMFASNKRVLYLFEPLKFMVGDMDAVTLKNQSHSQTAENLEALYNCDMFRYPYKTFSYFNQTPSITKECDHGTLDRFYECLAYYWTRCTFKPILTAKIIRSSTSPIKQMLNSRNSQFKVVVLLRDPRAIIRSWNYNGDGSGVGGEFIDSAADLCQRQKEFSLIAELSKQYPDQVTLIHSEDLILHLNESINHIYHTLKLGDAPHSVFDGLYNITHGIETGGYMSKMKMNNFKTFRNDSFISAFRWKTEFNYSYVNKIDAMCSDSYKYTGYQPVNFPHELTNMTILHRISSYDTF